MINIVFNNQSDPCVTTRDSEDGTNESSHLKLFKKKKKRRNNNVSTLFCENLDINIITFAFTNSSLEVMSRSRRTVLRGSACSRSMNMFKKVESSYELGTVSLYIKCKYFHIVIRITICYSYCWKK